MLSDNAQKVLKLLASANGQPVKAKDLQTQTGLSEAELQAAASELDGLGYTKLAEGGELAGLPLRFHYAFITNAGTAAAGKL